MNPAASQISRLADADFDELAMAYLDGACTDQQFADLQADLRDHAGRRRRFLGLCEWAESCAEITDARFALDEGVRLDNHTEVVEVSNIVRPQWPVRSKVAAVVLAAGVAALFIMVLARLQWGQAGSGQSPLAGGALAVDVGNAPESLVSADPAMAEDFANDGLSLLDPQPRGLVLISYTPIASLNPLAETGNAPQVNPDWLQRVDLWSVDRRDAESLLSDVDNLQPIRL